MGLWQCSENYESIQIHVTLYECIMNLQLLHHSWKDYPGLFEGFNIPAR